jgi:hypothetical protein
MDYSSGAPVKFPEWECHQVFSLRLDSLTGKSFLEISAFPKKEYPGIQIPWLTGDWSGYSTLTIIARIHDNRDSASFNLIVFDGRGQFTFNNRFEKEFIVDSGWTVCEVSLLGGLTTPAGRAIDMNHINQIVFFTERRMEPTVFDIGKIQLQ